MESTLWPVPPEIFPPSMTLAEPVTRSPAKCTVEVDVTAYGTYPMHRYQSPGEPFRVSGA